MLGTHYQLSKWSIWTGTTGLAVISLGYIALAGWWESMSPLPDSLPWAVPSNGDHRQPSSTIHPAFIFISSLLAFFFPPGISMFVCLVLRKLSCLLF